MDRRPRDIAKEVMDDEEQYALLREKDEHDYPYFKQVVAVYWIEQNTELP